MSKVFQSKSPEFYYQELINQIDGSDEYDFEKCKHYIQCLASQNNLEYQHHKDNLDHSTALHFACLYGKTEVVNFLIKNGADVNIVNFRGATPLHYTCEENDDIATSTEVKCEIITKLIESGAEIDAKDKYNLTPLFYCDSGAASKLLIDKGANVNNIGEDGSILGEACRLELWEKIDLLISKGAAINSQEGELSCLHKACENGNLDVIKLLLDHHADVNAKDECGLTPIEYLPETEKEEIQEKIQDYIKNKELTQSNKLPKKSLQKRKKSQEVHEHPEISSPFKKRKLSFFPQQPSNNDETKKYKNNLTSANRLKASDLVLPQK